MAQRGRPRKPTELKRLEGNRGHRPLNDNEPKPDADKVKCPTWLMPEAKKEWRRLAPMLIKMGLLTNADVQTFAGYCESYARWKEADQKLTELGSTSETSRGYETQSVWVNIAQKNLHQMKELGNEFGLSPVARSRLSAKAKDDSTSDMESLLSLA